MMRVVVSRPFLAILLVALTGAAWPFAAADAQAWEVDASITLAEDGLPMWDRVDEAYVRNVVVEVVNEDPAVPIVLVTVHAPEGLAFATAQPVPEGAWTSSWTRTSVEFLGTTGTADSASFVLRVLTSDPVGATFDVDVQSVVPTLFTRIPAVVGTSTVGGERVCQIVVETGVAGHTAFTPFASISETVPTFARAYVAVYDLRFGEYLDPATVVGQVRAVALDQEDAAPVLGADSLSVPFAIGSLPFSMAGVAPVLDPSSPGQTPVAVATLWGDEGPGRAWFAQRPGGFRILADAQVGASGCSGEAYNVARSVSPVQAPVGFTIGTPLVIVPPETDSDADGYVNINELRGNGNPLVALSTPYTDDDSDGVINVRDAMPLVRNE